MCLEMTLSLVLGPLLSAVKQGCVGSIDSILERSELACGGEGPVGVFPQKGIDLLLILFWLQAAGAVDHASAGANPWCCAFQQG